MEHVNKITLIGRVGKTPYTSDGNVTSFPLAVSEFKTDKTTNERTKETDWFQVVCFKELSSTISKYVGVSDLLYVEGKLKVKSFDHKGVMKFQAEVLAEKISMLHLNNKQPNP